MCYKAIMGLFFRDVILFIDSITEYSPTVIKDTTAGDGPLGSRTGTLAATPTDSPPLSSV